MEIQMAQRQEIDKLTTSDMSSVIKWTENSSSSVLKMSVFVMSS